MTVQEGGVDYRVVFVGGTSINRGVRLTNNTRHPSIAEDYARTFARLKELRADVFLAQHPDMFHMAAKRDKLEAGASTNPFLDRDGYRAFVQREEQKYLQQLQAEAATP